MQTHRSHQQVQETMSGVAVTKNKKINKKYTQPIIIRRIIKKQACIVDHCSLSSWSEAVSL